MTFLGLEVGSLAEWFSGVITAIGITTSVYFSLNKGNLKLDIKAEAIGHFELRYSIVNKSEFDVRPQMIYLSFRKHRYKQAEFARKLDELLQGRSEILKANVLRQASFRFSDVVKRDHALKNNMVVKYHLNTGY